MHNFLIAAFLIVSMTVSHKSESSGLIEPIIDRLEQQADIACIESHIQKINYGGIDVYDITCTLENSVVIYQYAPEQIILTHHVNKN